MESHLYGNDTRVECRNDTAAADRCKHRGVRWTLSGVLAVPLYQAQKIHTNFCPTLSPTRRLICLPLRWEVSSSRFFASVRSVSALAWSPRTFARHETLLLTSALLSNTLPRLSRRRNT